MKYAMVVVLLSVMAIPALAEDPGEAPDHGVARLSLLNGEVTVRRGDSGELVAAELNAPLVARDHVLTDANSRAEVQLDWGNFIRLASESEVRMAELADRDFLIQVAAGTVTFRVLRDSSSQLEISTPTVAIRPRLPGTYRITVRDDSSTEVTVRSGEAEIFTGGKSDFLRTGQTLLVSGDPSDPQRSYRAAISHDEWDRWNEDRDRDLERSDSYKYVSRDIYGAEDLAGHGRWVYDSPYGWVWVPTVDTAWAPYRVGRWSWVDYYGWTWISGDPWGWAPYHYGRWYNAPRYGWVWYPGEARVRNYWRPALVSFFGWGINVNVGWVPLAPYEIYRPWYGPGRAFVNNVTIVNNFNVVGAYRNARFVSGRNGVTSLVSGDFGRRRVTVNNFVAATDRDLSHAGDAGRWLQREPSRENRQFSDRQVSARVSARREPDRAFVSTRPERNGGNRREGDPSRVVLRSARSEPRASTGSTPDNARTPQRNETAAPLPGHQPEGNRGRGENSAGIAATGRPQENVRSTEGPRRNNDVVSTRGEPERARQPEGNRGRGENSAGIAATGQPQENVRSTEGPRRNNDVVSTRGEPERARQADSSRGRGGASAGPASVSSEPDRSRQSMVSRGAGENSTGTVLSSGSARRTETPQRNSNMVSFPRGESERVRQSDNGRARGEGFVRRETAEAPRVSAAPETLRRSEPVGRSAGSEPGFSRSTPPRIRPEEVQRPQVQESRPSRAPERERSQESAPAPRAESRSGGSAPQASSSAPASNSQGNSSGHSRGRDRR